MISIDCSNKSYFSLKNLTAASPKAPGQTVALADDFKLFLIISFLSRQQSNTARSPTQEEHKLYKRIPMTNLYLEDLKE